MSAHRAVFDDIVRWSDAAARREREARARRAAREHRRIKQAEHTTGHQAIKVAYHDHSRKGTPRRCQLFHCEGVKEEAWA